MTPFNYLILNTDCSVIHCLILVLCCSKDGEVHRRKYTTEYKDGALQQTYNVDGNTQKYYPYHNNLIFIQVSLPYNMNGNHMVDKL